MFDKYLTLSKDFVGVFVDRWTNTSREERVALFGTVAILGTCWRFSKIYFWCERRKTQKKIGEERIRLRKDKDELFRKLKKDKDIVGKKEEIVQLSFTELQKKLRDGKLTAKTVLRAYQLKAQEVNPDFNAIAHVIPDAEKLAEEYDASRKSLLLGGIPVTLKDHYTIKGRYATIGLGSYLFREATEDCVIVKVLKRHGAIPYFITTVPTMLMAKYYLVSFFMSVLWIAILSFGMVTLVARAGCLIGIDSYTMGLVVIAVGTSVLDALSSILVARDGYGDMAVSNAIGSNVFDINLGLGLPFIIRIAIDKGKPIDLLDDEERVDLLTGDMPLIPHAKFGFLLLIVLVFTLFIFSIVRFRLNKLIGISFVCMYVLFMLYAFLQELYCRQEKDIYC